MTDSETLQAINANVLTLINVGVWACRLLCIQIGLQIFRFITLRSPV